MQYYLPLLFYFKIHALKKIHLTVAPHSNQIKSRINLTRYFYKLKKK